MYLYCLKVSGKELVQVDGTAIYFMERELMN